MGCGCGGGSRGGTSGVKIQYKSTSLTAGVKSQPIVRPIQTRITSSKRCSKCNWPMASLRRYSPPSGKQVHIWQCMNRKCQYRE
jgi:hypothetical protein